MRKKNLFLAMGCFAVIAMSAQQAPKSNIFNLRHVVQSTTASPTQQTQLQTALTARREQKGTPVANSQYYSAIETILDNDQKQILFETFVNEDNVWKRVQKFTDQRNITVFPKVYLQQLQLQLQKNFRAQAIINLRYEYQPVLKTAAKAPLVRRLEILVSNINKDKTILRKLNVKLKLLKERCELETLDVKAYTVYNFYAAKNDSAFSKELIAAAKQSALSQIISKISSCNAQRVSDRMGALKKETDATKAVVKAAFTEAIVQDLQSKLEALQPLDVEIEALNLKAIASKYISAEKQDKANAAKVVFFKKAENAKLSKTKANILWDLITQRNADLKAYSAYKKTSNDEFAIVENVGVKTPADIRKAFQNAIVKLLTIDEFSDFLGDKLKPKVLEDSHKQLSAIQKEYKLGLSQQKGVLAKISDYYFSKAVYSYYYKHDRKKLSQKLSVLVFYFEKDYKALMEGYGITIDTPEKRKHSAYEW